MTRNAVSVKGVSKKTLLSARKVDASGIQVPKNKSQAGIRLGVLACRIDAPLITLLSRGSSEKGGPPNCKIVELTAALCVLGEGADKPNSLEG